MTPGGGRRADAAALLALAALVVVLFHQEVLQGRILYERDLLPQAYPWYDAFARALHAGSWPVWNPWAAFGQPMWAVPNYQVLYPPTWLNAVFTPARYYTLYVVAHTLLAAAGCFLAGRQLRLSRPAATTAAAVWIASGPFLSTVNLWNHHAGAAWLPWMLVAAGRVADGPLVSSAALWSVTVAAPLLAGSAEMAILGGLASGAWALSRGRARPARILAAAAVAALLAAGLSAGQWIPTREIVNGSIRGMFGDAERLRWSLHPWLLAEAVLPLRLDSVPVREDLFARLFESTGAYLTSIYVGLATLPLVFAPAARRRPRVLLAALALVALALALARHLPAYRLATALVPPLRLVRFPVKALLLASLAWALLAGLGLDAWRARRGGLVATSVTMAGAIGAWVAWAALHAQTAPARALLTAGASLGDLAAPMQARLLHAAIAATLAAGAAAVAWLSPARRRPALAAIAALAVVDLVTANVDLNRTAPAALATRRSPALPHLARKDARLYTYDYGTAAGAGHLKASDPALYRTPAEWPDWGPLGGARIDALEPFTTVLQGLRGSFDYDPTDLYSVEQRLLMETLPRTEGTPAHLRLLRMAAVDNVVTRHAEGLGDLTLLGTLTTWSTRPLFLWRVPEALPRVTAVGRGILAPRGPDLGVLLDPAFDPAAMVVLREGPALAGAGGPAGTARMISEKPDRLAIEVDLRTPGHVVVADGWAPGWTATLDGAPVPVQRANLVFRAVTAPAGHHVVEMSYRPRSVVTGLAITLVSLAVVFLLLALEALRSRDDPFLRP